MKTPKKTPKIPLEDESKLNSEEISPKSNPKSNILDDEDDDFDLPFDDELADFDELDDSDY